MPPDAARKAVLLDERADEVPDDLLVLPAHPGQVFFLRRDVRLRDHHTLGLADFQAGRLALDEDRLFHERDAAPAADPRENLLRALPDPVPAQMTVDHHRTRAGQV